jgi:YabP family.
MKKLIKKALAEIGKTRDTISKHVTELHMLGNKSAVIEGCMHIAEYDEENIRLVTKSNDICFYGQQLRLQFLDAESVEISGKIGRVEFL